MARGASPALVSLLAGAVLVCIAAQAGGAVKAAPPRAAEACARQRDDALAVAGGAIGAETRSLVRRIQNAFALFRFHRAKAAQAQLDGAVRQLESRPDLFRSRAEPTAKALEAMRSCVSSSQAPGLGISDGFGLTESARNHTGGTAKMTKKLPITPRMIVRAIPATMTTTV